MKSAGLFVAVVLPGCSLFFGPPDCPLTNHWGVFQAVPIAVTTEQHATVCQKYAGMIPPGCEEGHNPDFAKLPAAWDPSIPGSPILAMSLGMDVLTIELRNLSGDLLDDVAVTRTVAVPDMSGGHGWMGLLYSVDTPAPGESLSDVLGQAQECGELERTVFQYLVPGSVLAPGEDGQVLRALSPDALDLAAPDQIQALNVHAAFFRIGLPPAPFTRPIDPNDVRIYFTLRPDALSHPAVAGWFGGTPPYSATILVSAWDGSTWGPPQPYLCAGSLGLQAGAVIDGLAVDAFQAGNAKVLFSTRDAPEEEQLMYYSQAVGGTWPFVVELLPHGSGKYGSGGRRLKSKKALGDFCVADPWLRTFGAKVIDDYFVARSIGSDSGTDARLVVSGFRQKIGGKVLMRTCLTMRDPPCNLRSARVSFGRCSFTPAPNTAGAIGPVEWFPDSEGTQYFPFDGSPIVADHVIGDPGTTSITGFHAIVAQWKVRTRSGTLVAKTCVLRL